MFSTNKIQHSWLLITAVILAAVTFSACSPETAAPLSDQNQSPPAVDLPIKGQHPNDPVIIPVTGGVTQNQGVDVNQLEEQRLNNLASERWMGLAEQYQKAGANQQEGQRFNDPASLRWTELSALYAARKNAKDKYHVSMSLLPGR